VVRGYSLGLSLDQCAALAGVTGHCLRDWIRRGEEGQRGYTMIAAAMRGARARRLAKHTERLALAAESDWRACEALLERLNVAPDLDAERLSSLTRDQLIEWAANHPHVRERVLANVQIATVVEEGHQHDRAEPSGIDGCSTDPDPADST
jgi:transposase